MKIDYDSLSPGIRELVRELREEHCLQTTDSGDGTNYRNGMEGALPYRNVFMTAGPSRCINLASELHTAFVRRYPDLRIEVSYVVGDLAIICFFPDGIEESAHDESSNAVERA